MSSPPKGVVENGLDTLGTFTKPGYITIGDKYEIPKEMTRSGLKKGAKPILAPGPKDGKVGEGVFFDKLKPLYEKEPFADPHKAERERRKEENKKIRAGPFRPSSPSKKSTGPGSYYGTLGTPIEHKPDYDVTKKKEVTHEKKNMYTSPAKLGTYGFPNLGFSKDLPAVSPGKPEEKKMKKDAEKSSHPAFKTAAKTLDYFDTYPNVAASKIYTLDKELPPKKDSEKKKGADDKKPKPFIPPSPPKSGLFGTIAPFPKYEPEPFEKKKSAKKGEEEEKSKKAIWRSVGPSKTMPTKSIIFGSLNSTI